MSKFDFVKAQKFFFEWRFHFLAFFLGVLIALGGGYLLIYGDVVAAEDIWDLDLEVSHVSDANSDFKGSTAQKLLVDIRGAVKSPGVYEFEEGLILNEAINQAGGLSADVDQAWVDQNLNFVRELEDREKIYIPAKDTEVAGKSGTSDRVDLADDTVINLNSASKSELESLPGVGPATAGKIIDSRPYRQKTDLLNVSGIGEATYEKLKDKVAI